MNRFRCPKCGRFVSSVKATVNFFDTIVKVEGTCKKHNVVDCTNSSDWCYEDFFPEESE